METHVFSITLQRMLAYKRHLRKDSPAHEQLNQDIYRHSAGFYGEKSLDYYTSLITEPFRKVNYLRIPFKGKHFQMDTILGTIWFIMLIEIKNLTGHIVINHSLGTMEQNEGMMYQDPIVQVENQATQLKQWMQHNGYETIPIETLVVFVNKNVKLTREDGDTLDKRIIMSYKLNHKFNEVVKKYRNAPRHDTERLLDHLKKVHRPLDQNLMPHYNLTLKDFLPGIKCPTCFQVLQYYRGTWECPQCKFASKNLHLDHFKDYFLIFGPKITNRHGKYWFQLDSVRAMNYLLTSQGFESRRDRRHRFYLMDFNYQTDFSYLEQYLKDFYKNQM